MAKRASSRDASASASAPKTTRPRTRAGKQAAPAAAVTPAAVEAAIAVPDMEPEAAALPVPAVAATPVYTEMPTTPETATDQIAQLAYFFWQERGCPVGTGEEDWFRAERELSRAMSARA